MDERGASEKSRRLDLLWVREAAQPLAGAEASEVRCGWQLGEGRTEAVVAVVSVATRALAGEKPRSLRQRILAQQRQGSLGRNAAPHRGEVLRAFRVAFR